MARVLRLSEKDGLRNAIESILEHKEYGKTVSLKLTGTVKMKSKSC